MTDIAGHSGEIYRLTIDLKGSRPRIWRVVEVPGDVTLERMHEIIQVAMGWENRHLWSFHAGDRTFGDPSIDAFADCEPASETSLWEVAPKEGSRLRYKYDFGDGWSHDIGVEAIGPAEPGVQYPRCIGGARACPPEDCGGIPGYEGILSALGNGGGPEADEAIEWLGEDFDPAVFDMARVDFWFRRMDAPEEYAPADFGVAEDDPEEDDPEAWDDDAQSWLPGLVAEDLEDTPLEQLLDLILNWGGGVPVRAMERVIRMGDEALSEVGAELERWGTDDVLETPWLAIILGEIGSAKAIDGLIHHMCVAGHVYDSVAALEALAKIGAEAIPALAEVAHNGPEQDRLYAYGALGRISNAASYKLLVEALDRDDALTGVVGQALADQGRADAIPLLYRALERCDAWHRLELEDAIAELHLGKSADRLHPPDWRLRYQPSPGLGMFNVGWVGVAALTIDALEKTRGVFAAPVRPLEQMLTEATAAREASAEAELCETCGEAMEKRTGFWACPDTFVSTAILQVDLLIGAEQDGVRDLFNLMDEAQLLVWEIEEAGEDDREDAQEDAQEDVQWDDQEDVQWDDQEDVPDEEMEYARADMVVQTCRWLLGQGIEKVSDGTALLLEEAEKLITQYGDLDGILGPAIVPVVAAPRVGRNDPCPCGSGRKYKKCCGGPRPRH